MPCRISYKAANTADTMSLYSGGKLSDYVMKVDDGRAQIIIC